MPRHNRLQHVIPVSLREGIPTDQQERWKFLSCTLLERIASMDYKTYINAENWLGSYYELAIELQDSPDDAKLFQALKALWSYPSLSGGWLSKEDYGQLPINFADGVADIESLFHIYGLVTLPTTNVQFGCLSVVVREELGEGYNSDWLGLCFPVGMLEQVFTLEYPLDYESNAMWMDQIDMLLRDIANSIYEQVRFELAILGEEVSGYVNKAELPFEDDKNSYLITPAVWNRLWSMGLNDAQLKYKQLPSGLIRVL